MIKVMSGHLEKREAEWSSWNGHSKEDHSAVVGEDPLKNLKIHLELVMVSDEQSGRDRGLSSNAMNQFLTVILIVIGIFLAIKVLQVVCAWCINNREKAENEALYIQECEDEQQQASELTSPIARDEAAPEHRISIPNEIPILFNGKKGEEGEWNKEKTEDSHAGIEVNQEQYLEILGATAVFETTNKDWEHSDGDSDTKQIIKQ